MSTPRHGGQSRLSRRHGPSRLQDRHSPYLYISPFFILFALVGLYPLLYSSWVSVHDWHLIGGQGDFVGLRNYVEVLGRERFWRALANTASIFVLSTVPLVAMALALAAVLDARIRARTFWRMGVLLPYVVAPVAVSLIFANMFAEQSGIINALLTGAGLDPVGWHSDRLASHVAIATMVGFRWTGYTTLLLLAAMRSVPRDLYEAALVDGAGRLRQFVSVTVPSIRATIIFVVIITTITGLQVFDEPRMYDIRGYGGSDRQWMTLSLYLYELGYGTEKSLGLAAAVTWILFLLILAVSLVNLAITRRITSGGAHPSAGGGADRRAGRVTYATLGVVLLAAAAPLWYAVLLASSDAATIARNPVPPPVPGGNLLANLERVVTSDVNFFPALWNSAVVGVVTAVSVALFSTLAGYSFAKLDFRGRGPLLVVIIATMAVPTQLSVVPLFILMSRLGWIGDLKSVIVPGLVTAFGVFWMTQYLRDALPTELIEAARVDGCSLHRTFWHIALPTARPAAALLALVTFAGSWTTFFWPYIALGSAEPTLPVALQLLQASYFKDYSMIMAGVVAATIPLVLVFIAAGRHLVSGIMQGAVKG